MPPTHPEVAVDLARWSDPELGVELGLVLINQFFSGELTTELSMLKTLWKEFGLWMAGTH